jgi:hypothetical protein
MAAAAAVTGARAKEVLGFSLTKAQALAFRVINCPHNFRPSQKWPWWNRLRRLSLVKFILLHLDLALQWQASLSIALFVLVIESPKRPGEKCLLFDGRLWAKAAGPKTICWLISRSSGKLMHQYNDVSQFQEIVLPSLQQKQLSPERRQSLCEFLGLGGPNNDISFSNPQNLFDLRQCLNTYCSGGGGRDAQDRGVMVVQGEDRDICFSMGVNSSWRPKLMNAVKFSIKNLSIDR